MHARSTTIHGDPRSVEAATAYVRDEVMPTVRGMDGCLGLSMLADHDTRRCIITTSWRNEAAMRAPEAGRRSVGEYAEDYLARSDLREATRALYSSLWRHHLAETWRRVPVDE
jgi:quinol monooxygenase YgiN